MIAFLKNWVASWSTPPVPRFPVVQGIPVHELWDDEDYDWDNKYLDDSDDEPIYVPRPRVKLECKLLHPDAKVPTRTRSTDAGYDLTSVETVTVKAKSQAIVDTGIAVSAPPGYYYTIDGRSSLFKNQVIPFRGIIDGGYTGRLYVILLNISENDYEIEAGHRIAQIIIQEIINCDIDVVSDFSPEYLIRGEAGWGSSGQ